MRGQHGPGHQRRKDRYQPRAASASQPKTLKTYACSAIGRDRLTSEERLSDIVEILAQGLLWLDVLRDYHGSIRSHTSAVSSPKADSSPSGLIRPRCIGLPPPTSTAS